MSACRKSLYWSGGIEAVSWLALGLSGFGTAIFSVLHLPAILIVQHLPQGLEVFWLVPPLQVLIWFLIWFVPLKLHEWMVSRKEHIQ